MLESPASVAAAASRQRKAVVPPSEIPAGTSLFDYLRNCTPPLDRKIVDIACAKAKVPLKLRQDASQEITLMWSQTVPEVGKYKPGQIAAYATRMACHKALWLRREMGAAVRLPGSAFRKKKDGTSYVTPGVLAEALDWNDLENWFQTDSEAGNAEVSAQDGLELEGGLFSPDGMDVLEAIAVEEDEDMARQSSRLESIEAQRHVLSTRQYEIMCALVAGHTFEEIQTQHGIKKGVLLREIAVASAVMGTDEL